MFETITNSLLKEAINIYITWRTSLMIWVHIENTVTPMSEKYLFAIDMRTTIEDAKVRWLGKEILASKIIEETFDYIEEENEEDADQFSEFVKNNYGDMVKFYWAIQRIAAEKADKIADTYEEE